MMTLYIYRLLDGLFLYEDAGSTSGIIYDLGEGESKDKDFTLVPPPDSEHQWRWIEDEWVADEEVVNELDV